MLLQIVLVFAAILSPDPKDCAADRATEAPEVRWL